MRSINMPDPTDALVNERPAYVRPTTLLARKLVAHRNVTSQDGRYLDAVLQRNQRSVEAGTPLVELGSPHSEIHVILEGWALRRKPLRGGGNQIVAIHVPGDICEFNAVLGTASDTETVAVDRVRTGAISARTLNELATHPRLSRALWLESMASGSIQRQWFASIACSNAAVRMAHLLCELEQRLSMTGEATVDGHNRAFTCPLTQLHLGNATAMSVEHSNRTLGHLRRQFGLSARNGRIEIQDLPAMQEFCGFDAEYISLETNNRPLPMQHSSTRAVFQDEKQK